MTRAAVALGSNLGDRRANLEFAVRGLASCGEVVGVSGLYETAPVGGPEQGPYLNAVAIVDTMLPAEQLLAGLHDIERRRGRTRTIHWGPRTLDLDLLLYGRESHATDDCVVPHPRMHERRFVVEPLLNVWPEAALPDGTRVSTLKASVADQDLTDLGVWWPPRPAAQGFVERGGWWVAAQFLLIGLVVVALGTGGPVLPGGSALRVGGAVVALAGLALGMLGLRHLGDRLTPFPEPLAGGEIIRAGVYAKARHPIYGGTVLGLAGMALFGASLYGLLAAMFAGVFFWMKAGREERRLLDRFPHYAEYRERTRARLVPWVL